MRAIILSFRSALYFCGKWQPVPRDKTAGRIAGKITHRIPKKRERQLEELNMKNSKLQTWVRLALLVAIEVAMRLLGLGKVPVGPLNMSFLTLPIAVGGICMGPVAGLVLGAVFGVFSLYDAVSGAGGMTAAFFQYSPVHTVILTVGMRMLMGLCCGLIYKGLRKMDAKGYVSYFVGAISAPLLNTLFFMGYCGMQVHTRPTTPARL